MMIETVRVYVCVCVCVCVLCVRACVRACVFVLTLITICTFIPIRFVFNQLKKSMVDLRKSYPTYIEGIHVNIVMSSQPIVDDLAKET